MKETGRLINKVLLIGITVLDEKDELIKQIQVYGSIVQANADGIVILRKETNTEFSIPPDFDNINEAELGDYHLRSTGEIVVDPDYISSWTVHSGSEERIEQYSKYGFSGYEKP
jgi:hypothetical protein